MKNQALFSLKDKSKKLKCRLLQFLFGALRVKFIQNATYKERPQSNCDIILIDKLKIYIATWDTIQNKMNRLNFCNQFF